RAHGQRGLRPAGHRGRTARHRACPAAPRGDLGPAAPGRRATAPGQGDRPAPEQELGPGPGRHRRGRRYSPRSGPATASQSRRICITSIPPSEAACTVCPNSHAGGGTCASESRWASIRRQCRKAGQPGIGMNVVEGVGGGRPGAEELLLRVAWFYYKDELTQDEIAKRLAVSRASVGRMLDRARRVGLVSINLNAGHLDAFEISGRLRRAFNLTEALVVPDHEQEPADRHILNARLGLGGAQFMSTHLRPGGILGVGWGETVSRVITSINFGAVGPVHMVSLTGGVDGYLQTILSSKGEGAAEPELTTARIIPTPIVASTPALAAALKAEPTIQQGLRQGPD